MWPLIRLLAVQTVAMLPLFGATPKDIQRQLTLGQSIEIQLNKKEELLVAPKSIVSILEIGAQRFRLTTQRTGFEIVQVIDAEGEIKDRYLIHVRRSAVDVGSVDLCKGYTLDHCSFTNGRLTGTAQSFQAWKALSEICRSLRHECQFGLQLSESALEVVRVELKALDQKVEAIRMTEFGGFLVQVRCTDSKSRLAEIDKLLSQVLDPAQIVVSCLHESQQNYTVKAKIVLIGSDQLQERGISFQDLDVFSATQNVLQQLRLQSLSNKIEIIGEPEALAIAGRRLEILSGGEMRTPREKPRTDGEDAQEGTGWKVFGLQMGVQIESLAGEQVLIDSDIRLSAPRSETEIQSHRFHSQFNAEIGQTIFAGKAEVSASEEYSSGPFVAMNIPILGPLFRLYRGSQMNQWICIWIKVSRSSLVTD